MPHDANVITKDWHAIPCVKVKNVPIPMVQSLQSYLLRREIDIIIVCKWRFHQVKSLQLIEVKLFLKQFDLALNLLS